MSNIFSKATQFAITGLVIAVSLGCQDGAAPITGATLDTSKLRVSASQSSKAPKKLINDQYIVVFREGTSDVAGNAKKLVGRTKGKLKHTFASGLKGFSASMTDEEARAIADDKSVAYVEQDQIVAVGAGQPTSSGTTSTSGKGGKTTTLSGTTTQKPVPSWGLDRVDQSALPMNSSYLYTATGTGVNAYIIDSGILTTHVEFGGRASADVDFVGDGYGATGCNWHGTHVAGTVGGATVGVAKGVRLHSVRVLDCNASGQMSNVIAAIDWVIANRIGPSVINLSISGGFSTAVTDAVDRATVVGIVVVVAAGNDAADACNYSPSSARNALTVGATNSGDQLASFSDVGSCIDMFAPGDAIMSASNTDNVSLQYGSGTSMAAPHVAGAVALYLEKNPAASPSSVIAALLARATPGLIGGLTTGTANLLIRTP